MPQGFGAGARSHVARATPRRQRCSPPRGPSHHPPQSSPQYQQAPVYHDPYSFSASQHHPQATYHQHPAMGQQHPPQDHYLHPQQAQYQQPPLRKQHPHQEHYYPTQEPCYLSQGQQHPPKGPHPLPQSQNHPQGQLHQPQGLLPPHQGQIQQDPLQRQLEHSPQNQHHAHQGQHPGHQGHCQPTQGHCDQPKGQHISDNAHQTPATAHSVPATPCPAPSAHASTGTPAPSTTTPGSTTPSTVPVTTPVSAPTPPVTVAPTYEPEPMWKRIAVTAGGAALGSIVSNIGMSAVSGLMGGGSSGKVPDHRQAANPPSSQAHTPGTGKGSSGSYPGPGQGYLGSYSGLGQGYLGSYPGPGQGFPGSNISPGQGYPGPNLGQGSYPSQEPYSQSSPPPVEGRNSHSYYITPAGQPNTQPTGDPSSAALGATKSSLPEDPNVNEGLKQSDPNYGQLEASTASLVPLTALQSPLISPKETSGYQQSLPSPNLDAPDGSDPFAPSREGATTPASLSTPIAVLGSTFIPPRSPTNNWSAPTIIQEQYKDRRKDSQKSRQEKKSGGCCSIM